MRTKKRGPVKGTKLEQVQRSEFGQRLFKVRRSRGVSQEELGRKIGVSLRVISYYERDEYGPPVMLAKKIAKALNVSVSYLMGESPLKLTANVDFDPLMKKHLDALQKLPRRDLRKIYNMTDDLVAKNELQKKLEKSARSKSR